jgi:hypothetical protein
MQYMVLQRMIVRQPVTKEDGFKKSIVNLTRPFQREDDTEGVCARLT